MIVIRFNFNIVHKYRYNTQFIQTLTICNI
jgi:hypothetical protein